MSIDIIPTSNADIVAEAEALPFQDNSIDMVCSGAVFEHLHSPLEAIAEVRRVLKEGGELYIETAFMVTYHGYPSHYFNMTPQAIETYLVDDFHLTASVVPPAGSVVNSMSNLLGRLLSALPEAGANRIREMKVGDFLSAMLAQRNSSNALFDGLSDYSHRAMAASYVVRARKPPNYTEGVARAEETIGKDGWKSLKRKYYSARNAVMRLHHDVAYYRRMATERGLQIDDVRDVYDLSRYLLAGTVVNPMSVEAWSLAIARLDGFVDHMTKIRLQLMRRCQG